MRESFTELYPGPMALLPHLRFIEPLNPNDEKFKYPSEPYVFVCDYVVRSEDYIDVTACMAQGISQAAWDAMARLRDEVAKDERIGWYAVHNGDLELAQEERNRMKLQQAHEGAEVTDEVAQRLEVRNLRAVT